MTVLETERLLLSRLSYDDCEFILELVNEHSFKRFIGDKNVNSFADARRYLADEPIAARAPSSFYHVRKFAKRNKAIVGVLRKGACR